MDTKTLLNLIDERKEELFELLSSFVKINTENFRTGGNEKELAEHIHKLCLDLGLESDIYSPLEIDGFENHPDFMPGGHLENRPNVMARYKGTEDTDYLMLMAHTDTVEIGDLNNWEKEPLSGEIKDGKIFGRGSGDDKYALATIFFIMKLLKENNVKLKKNLLFAAYCDEEHGGSHGALASVLKYPCPHIVNLDCREDQIWHCGSGGQEVSYRYHTKETVDSAKLTASAIPIVMEEIDKFAARRKQELEENPYYKGTIIPETSLRYMDVHAGNHGNDLGVGDLYFTYYTDKTKEEIYAEFHELEETLKKRLEPLGIIGDGIKPRTRFFHYVHCEPDSPDVLKMVEAAKVATGEAPLVCGSCLSDLSVISKYGSANAYAFGMGRDFSKKGGAHQPNEFIESEKFVGFTKTIAAFVLDMLA